jgi:hypothetical protein
VRLVRGRPEHLVHHGHDVAAHATAAYPPGQEHQRRRHRRERHEDRHERQDLAHAAI